MECPNDTIRLPKTYVLHENDVLCGRGKTCREHTGTVRFYNIITRYLHQYNQLRKSRIDKTGILDAVIDEIYATGGNFVKFDTDTECYFKMGAPSARSKTSQAFRDAIQDQYRSSSYAKTNKKSKHKQLKTTRNRLVPSKLTSIEESKCSKFPLNENEGNLHPLFTHANSSSTSPVSDKSELKEIDMLAFPVTFHSDHMKPSNKTNNLERISRSNINYGEIKFNEETDSKPLTKSLQSLSNRDALTFERLLQISMKSETFNDNDPLNPRPIG